MCRRRFLEGAKSFSAETQSVRVPPPFRVTWRVARKTSPPTARSRRRTCGPPNGEGPIFGKWKEFADCRATSNTLTPWGACFGQNFFGLHLSRRILDGRGWPKMAKIAIFPLWSRLQLNGAGSARAETSQVTDYPRQYVTCEISGHALPRTARSGC